jgi:transposase-like protein
MPRRSQPANPTKLNGTSSETVLTDDGPVDIKVPRDRDGSF